MADQKSEGLGAEAFKFVAAELEAPTLEKTATSALAARSCGCGCGCTSGGGAGGGGGGVRAAAQQ
jgi:hypothetical protein